MREATTEELLERIKELEDKVQMHDFFWEGCGFKRRGFKNTIGVSQYVEELEARIKELEADYEAVMHAALVHSDENDKLNKELEDAENTYYVTKGQLDLANERIKELEAENIKLLLQIDKFETARDFLQYDLMKATQG